MEGQVSDASLQKLHSLTLLLTQAALKSVCSFPFPSTVLKIPPHLMRLFFLSFSSHSIPSFSKFFFVVCLFPCGSKFPSALFYLLVPAHSLSIHFLFRLFFFLQAFLTVALSCEICKSASILSLFASKQDFKTQLSGLNFTNHHCYNTN